MIRKNYFIISFDFFVTKIIAWLIFLCIILSSMFVLNNNIDDKIIKSVDSVENVLVQFFSVSSMPADFISKMFIQNTEKKLSATPIKQEQNKSNKNTTENPSKDSIMPTPIEIVNMVNTKNILRPYMSAILFGNLFAKQFSYDSFFVDTLCTSFNINLILMMLLLAILLSQKNLGEDGISNINIKNRYNAQFA